MDYNKIICLLKCTRIINDWLDNFGNIYQFINKARTRHLNHSKTMPFQIPMTRKSGGLGLRSPTIFYSATKITALSDKLECIKGFFEYETSMKQDQLNLNNVLLTQQFEKTTIKYIDYEHQMIQEFNEVVGPDLVYVPSKDHTHKQLLELIDKKLLSEFYKVAETHDIARIKCLSVNGATSWMDVVPNNHFGMDVVPNNHFGIEYNNQEYLVLMSLYLGCDIINNDQLCKKCGAPMDKKGYHALHCKCGKHVIQRHNMIRNEVNKYMKKADYSTKLEQKYKYNDSNQMSEEVKGIPGDLVVTNWMQNSEHEDYYMDVVVGNIFADSYVKSVCQKRLGLATLKEQKKLEKYNHKPNIIPLAMEVMGGVGKQFRLVLQKMASRISDRTNKPQPIIMNRLRKNIVAKLMKANCQMILSSVEM